MKKRILIALFIVIILIYPTRLSEEQSIIVNSKKVDTELVYKKEVKETKPMTVVFKSRKSIQPINILVSFYTSSYADCSKNDAISTSGKNLNQLSDISRGLSISYVAAPRNIVFGTMIRVINIGDCIVEDRGGKIKYVWIEGIEYMKLDVFIPGATAKEISDKGIVKTRGYIVK